MTVNFSHVAVLAQLGAAMKMTKYRKPATLAARRGGNVRKRFIALHASPCVRRADANRSV